MSDDVLTFEKLDRLRRELMDGTFQAGPETFGNAISPGDAFGGMPVFSSHYVPDGEYETRQFRFPRSKRRRIRKKWSKRPENFRKRLKERFVYQTPFGIFSSPGNLLMMDLQS